MAVSVLVEKVRIPFVSWNPKYEIEGQAYTLIWYLGDQNVCFLFIAFLFYIHWIR